MKNIIVYSGHYDVSMNGSTKELDENLVRHIFLEEYNVVWIGVGVDKTISTKLTSQIFDINKEFLSLRILSRLLNLFKKIKLISSAIFQNSMLILYDYFLKIFLKKDIISIDNSILIVRNGAATESINSLKKSGLKTIILAQWCHPNFQQTHVENSYSKLGIKFIQKSDNLKKRQIRDYSLADRIWTFCNFSAETFTDEGISPSKLIIQHTGADKNKFYFRDSDYLHKNKKNQFRLLFIGNISPEKGVESILKYLLSSMCKVTEMIFMGGINPVFLNYFETNIIKIQKKGIKCIIKQGDSSLEYSKADAVILSSIHDSFGLVVPEALISGIPVIVSSHSGSKELVTNPTRGEVYDVYDSEDMINKINKVFHKKTFFKENRQLLSDECQYLDWELIFKKLSVKIQNELL